MNFTEMTLSAEEIRTVYAVFDELRMKKYSELNTFLGSETIKDMRNLASKIHCSDYCSRHGIKYEEMTDDDYIYMYEEEYSA